MYQSHGSYGNLETVSDLLDPGSSRGAGGFGVCKGNLPQKTKKKFTSVLLLFFVLELSLRKFHQVEGLCKHLGGGNSKIFIFTPELGEDSHSDDYIFQMGWFNHQLDMYFNHDFVSW